MIAVQIAGHYESALQMAASGSPLTWDKLPRVKKGIGCEEFLQKLTTTPILTELNDFDQVQDAALHGHCSLPYFLHHGT